LVGFGRACPDEALAHAMLGQHSLLLDILHGHETHMGARHRLANVRMQPNGEFVDRNNRRQHR
jgi:hypothetical protein